MLVNNKGFHLISILCLVVMFMIITFSISKVMMIFSILFFCIVTFINTNNVEKIKKGIVYFIPFALITTIINLLFVTEGRTVLFHIFNHRITLESLTYAIILSLKLLIIIYLFSILDILIDSDQAVSYFSTKFPKVTLMFLMTFKLFPTMKYRIQTIKEVYIVRGVNFEGKSLKDKIKSYVPILSILLETSMDGAFDIGEAAYVRGFLSGKRTIYEKIPFHIYDYIIIFLVITLPIMYFFSLKVAYILIIFITLIFNFIIQNYNK